MRRPPLLAIVLAACSSSTPARPAAIGQDAPPGAAPITTRSPEVTRALADLDAADWSTVWQAAGVLSAHRDEALPQLVLAVRRDERVELEGTADLIYPGAPAFYGHGMLIAYDLDHLGDRAGWLLEGLVFRDFGFRAPSPAPGAVEPAADAERRRRDARAAVAAWWDDAEGTEFCHDSLVRAVIDGAPAELADAYAWLRGQSWPCAGFSDERFRTDLEPAVRAHAADPAHPMQRQAELLLEPEVDGLR